MTEVFVVSAVRTAIGSFGGSLRDQKPGELAGRVAGAAMERAKVAPELVDSVVLGNVIHTEPRDAYAARIAAIGAGIPVTASAFSVNRLCGSGLQAIVSAAQAIKLGDAAITIGAGAEIMSRAPYFVAGARWGLRMGDGALQDGLLGALTDPFQAIHMGVTAENVAKKYGISREQQDALAVESQRRAFEAISQGHFRDQILPIALEIRGKRIIFDVDEFVRPIARMEDLAKLPPAFQSDGTVTAGNASGINDGAAAVVLASGEAVRSHGLKPLARLVAYGHTGVEPAYMGIGPVPATRKALERAGLTVADLDVIESNEAFAAQACAVAQALGFDADKVNPNGSGISLGHPVGATGAIIVTKLVHELHRTNGRYGLATMCIGGGQGIAAIWERV